MDILYLLFLFLDALVFTVLFTMVIGNRGPWNNPMFFFLILFLTSWTLILWLGPNMHEMGNVAYLHGTGVTALVTLLLAATETPHLEPIQRVKSKTGSRKFYLISKNDGRSFLIRPNAFFWILLGIESCMIMLAYFLQYKQNQGI